MQPKIFRPALTTLLVCLATLGPCWGQTIQAGQAGIAPAQAGQPAPAVNVSIPALPALPEIVIDPAPVAVQATVQTLKAALATVKTQLQCISLTSNAQVSFTKKSTALAMLSVKAPVPAVTVEALNTVNGQVNVVKNYSKVYPANGGDALVIDNRYGDIVVNTWDKDQFKVDVQITVDADNESDAQKALDNVNISDAKNGSTVAFRTDIGSASGSWLSWLTGDHKGHKLKILYTVYMPAKNDLVISNSYGAVQLPDLNGKVTVKCAYGALKARSLNNESTIRASYSSVDLGALDATWIDISYGSLTVGSVNRIASNASYTAVKIGRIHESGAFNIRYAGPFSIGDIDKGLADLAINASYSNIDIGLSGDENVNFNINLHYGDLDYGNRTITFTDKTPDDGKPHNTKTYKGALGKGNPDKNIAINSSYGNVTFN